MAFADPQTLTIGATPVTLPRVNVGQGASDYSSADGLVKLKISSTYGKRNRRVVRLEHQKIGPDPFTSTTQVPYSMTAYIVMDTPKVGGYTVAQQKEIVDALLAYMSASAGASITKVIGGES